MAKIFVTGATGLIGVKLTKRLLEEGHEVAGFTTSQNGKEKLQNAGVKPYIGNIFDYDTIDAAIGDFKPDVIMNEVTDLKNVDMAANTKVRIEGTKNLVDAAIKHGDKVRETQGKAQGLLGKAREKAADLKEDIEQGAEKLKEKFEKDDKNK